MNRFVAVEYLKTFLGTLFLATYDLPSYDVVKSLINEVDIRLKRTNSFRFYHPLVTLRNLINNLEERIGDLLMFSENSFLKKFSDRMLDNGAVVFPFSKAKSTLMFFQNFLNYDYCPINEAEMYELLEWSLLSVQFEEANKERTQEAMTLLKSIRDYIDDRLTQTRSSCYTLLDDFDIADDMNGVMKGSVGKDDDDMNGMMKRSVGKDEVDVGLMMENYRDTKHCDCFEYESSGDCHCTYDC